MPETPSLGLPLLVAEQAQKHVTHNEALRVLDAIVQLAVKDRDLTDPPGSPSDGDRYVAAAGATGDWAGHDGEIAAWQDGAWAFYTPAEGWCCWVDDENAFLIFTGSAWLDFVAALGALQNVPLLGVGTIADATNPFSAKLNKALWTAKYASEGGDGDLRYTLNKETAADTVSLLFQDGYSGRAEIGLVGDDDLTFKVSPDGSAWTAALVVDRTSGKLKLVADPTDALGAATKQYVDGIVAVQDAMVFKGVIDCSANPNYPAGNRGDTYRVSVAGKIGGGSGSNVEAGDLLICLTDGTASGTQAGVGAQWTIAQTNLDGAVIGPASVTDNMLARFDGTTGKLLQSSLLILDDNGLGTILGTSGQSPGFYVGISTDTVGRISLGINASDEARIGMGAGGSSARDVFLTREAAGVFGQHNSTNAQTLRGYRTRTDASNYERWALQSGSGYMELASESAGTGTANIDLRLTSKGSGAVTLGNNAVLKTFAGAGPVIDHDPTATSGAGGFKFRHSYANVAETNGPVGQTNYVDDVWGIGLNMATGGSARIDATKPSLGLTWESKYYGSSSFNMEFHLQGFGTDGNSHRPFSFQIPQDGLGGISTCQWSVNQVIFANWDSGHNLLQIVDPALTGYSGTLFTFSAPTTFASNNRILSLVGPNLTGHCEFLHVTGTVTGSLYSKIVNSGTGGTFVWLEAAAGGGNPRIDFVISSTTWSVGLDNSDSDVFKISRGDPGTNTALRMDANVAAFSIAPKLPSYTVAGVPSASTLGAGSLIYVSNESGGATVAFSDGTNWRRVTDNAVIS